MEEAVIVDGAEIAEALRRLLAEDDQAEVVLSRVPGKQFSFQLYRPARS